MSSPADIRPEPAVELPDELSTLPEDASVIEVRRYRVEHLRIRRQSAASIAAVMNIPVATVYSDLAAIRRQRREQFGPTARFDAADFIGESLAVYQQMETAAILEASRITDGVQERGINPMFAARQRAACWETAMNARDRQIKLLEMHGHLSTVPRDDEPSVPRAHQLRRLMQAVRVSDRELMSPAERAWRDRDAQAIDVTPVPPTEGSS